MTTPALITTASTYTSVRLYTQFDPYFYTIDNRPLTDLGSNDTFSAIGADAARRGELINAVGRAIAAQQTYGTANFTTGLTLTTGANTVTVGYGALYQPLALTASDSAVVVKQAALRRPQTFSIPAPGTVGQSQYFLLEGQYVDFGGSTSSDFPFWDATNGLLPSSLLNGELQLKITAGTAATTGTETPPAASGGNWVQLYLFDIANGATTYTIQQPYTPVHAYSAPQTIGLFNFHRANALTTVGAGASMASVGDTPSLALAKGSNGAGLFTIPLIDQTSGIPQTNLLNINPYRPIRFKIMYSAATAGANSFGIRAKYQSFGSGDNVSTASYTASTTEALTAAGTSNFALTYTTGATAVIPASAIQTALTAGKYFMNVVLERVIADGNDTNAATMNVYDVIAFQ